ncbi:MAG: AvaI/BsoBI family type II restriction endonuclease [Anaerolineaceae bacterium]
MLTPNIQKSSDLITSRSAICNGFLTQAITKTEKASEFVREAKNFMSILKKANNIDNIMHIPEIRDHLISAAGFSTKASSHLDPKELDRCIEEILIKIFDSDHNYWREEILYRYLLTKGDTLGGSMRNVTGNIAKNDLIKAIQNALKKCSIKANFSTSPTDHNKIQSISWPNRLLLFDKKPKIISKNIDVILLSSEAFMSKETELMEIQDSYIACGELKGGIDPAGADEHWKTANTALDRIRTSFKGKKCPALFFIGASIEEDMANEIFEQLKSDRLTFAANLTFPNQVSSLASWLVNL